MQSVTCLWASSCTLKERAESGSSEQPSFRLWCSLFSFLEDEAKAAILAGLREVVSTQCLACFLVHGLGPIFLSHS